MNNTDISKICKKCEGKFVPSRSFSKFCSDKCRTSYNNKKSREKRAKKCKCGKKILPESTLCRPCFLATKPFITDLTLRDFFNSPSMKDKHPSWRYSQVRNQARRIFKRLNAEIKCEVCGYNLHVEVCHKKAISEFDLETKISEVNSKDNLVGLCPNHHWEFDNGLLRV